MITVCYSCPYIIVYNVKTLTIIQHEHHRIIVTIMFLGMRSWRGGKKTSFQIPEHRHFILFLFIIILIRLAVWKT